MKEPAMCHQSFVLSQSNCIVERTSSSAVANQATESWSCWMWFRLNFWACCRQMMVLLVGKTLTCERYPRLKEFSSFSRLHRSSFDKQESSLFQRWVLLYAITWITNSVRTDWPIAWVYRDQHPKARGAAKYDIINRIMKMKYTSSLNLDDERAMMPKIKLVATATAVLRMAHPYHIPMSIMIQRSW